MVSYQWLGMVQALYQWTWSMRGALPTAGDGAGTLPMDSELELCPTEGWGWCRHTTIALSHIYIPAPTLLGLNSYAGLT